MLFAAAQPSQPSPYGQHQYPPPVLGQPVAQPCRMTRAELERILKESDYGKNEMMFSMYFAPNPCGGPPVCATCHQPMGSHDQGLVAPQLPSHGIDVNATPAVLQRNPINPNIEQSDESDVKCNMWFMMLLHAGLIFLPFTCHKTHVEIDHGESKARYVRKYLLWPCLPHTWEIPFKDLLLQHQKTGEKKYKVEVKEERSKHSAWATVRLDGPGCCLCDPECGWWDLGKSQFGMPEVQMAHKTQWENYLSRLAQKPARPSMAPSITANEDPSFGVLRV